MKKVLVSVSNDLAHDQRVHKVCCWLLDQGVTVKLVGRKLSDSPGLSRKYKTYRFPMMAKRGPLFYAFFNIRLFFYLFWQKPHLLIANDLDTLPANVLASKLRSIPLVYDSHELFTEVPELTHRPFVKSVWKFFERWGLKQVKRMYTVSKSIASIYSKEYSREVFVVRNIPLLANDVKVESRKMLGLPPEKRILILQGGWINKDRGGEEALAMMHFLPEMLLLVVGSGDAIPNLKDLVLKNNLEDRVLFLPKMRYEELLSYTAAADLGLSLDKDTNLNYKYSLPNKLFDYIHAGTPVLVSDLPEVGGVVQEFGVGAIASDLTPQVLAKQIQTIFTDVNTYKTWRENCKKARQVLNWQHESEELAKVYADLL